MLFEDQVIEFNELTDPLFTEKKCISHYSKAG
jgi:hypothetical protein